MRAKQLVFAFCLFFSFTFSCLFLFFCRWFGFGSAWRETNVGNDSVFPKRSSYAKVASFESAHRPIFAWYSKKLSYRPKNDKMLLNAAYHKFSVKSCPCFGLLFPPISTLAEFRSTTMILLSLGSNLCAISFTDQQELICLSAKLQILLSLAELQRESAIWLARCIVQSVERLQSKTSNPLLWHQPGHAYPVISRNPSLWNCA